MVRDALRWGALAVPVGTVAGYVAGGGDGALSVSAALVLVLGNTAAAAGILSWAAKRFPRVAPAAALPSYAVRMAAVTLAMAALLGAPFIERSFFLSTFCVAVVATLAIEARTFARTPWAALTFLDQKPALNDRRS